MNTATLFYFFLSSILIAALPGPAMMLVIQGAVKDGWRAGLAVTLGILAADAVLLAAVCVGLGGLMAASPKILFAMNAAAALYLLYLGARSLYEIRSIRGGLVESGGNTGWKTGFFVTIINPKTIIFLLAYFPQFIDASAPLSETAQLLVLSALFLLAVAVVMLVYTQAAHVARNYLARPIARRVMALVFGLLLVYIGAEGLISLFV